MTNTIYNPFKKACLEGNLAFNLFDGQIHYVEPQREYTVDTPMSLSYFIGLGYEEADMQYVESFHLTAKGWIMAVLFIFGFPALFAYRMYMRAKKSDTSSL